MQADILATKLYRPPLKPETVLRPRLIALLADGLPRKLTLICAPAGFGKTTLAIEWAAACGRPAAWLSLDAADRDPARFLSYVIAALRSVAPQMGVGLLRALEGAPPPASEAILTTLLNELVAQPEKFVLVLDDLHVIDSPAVDQALAFLIDQLPPQLSLVITTREDPHLPLAKLRARGALCEVRAADLRFNHLETGGFLTRAMALPLSVDDIVALEARTEGWITGLQLAAISMRGRADTARFIAGFGGSHAFVLDYLVEEVLQQQPQHVQDFLLRTSILDSMCGPLCDALLQAGPEAQVHAAGAGQAILDHIQHANLFVVPLDDARQWFRYHHLFAGLLRQRLMQSPIANSIVEGRSGLALLHQCASQWHEQQGATADAMRHALEAADVARVARLAELAWPAMDARLQSGLWLGWVKALPDAVIQSRPVLCVAHAWALLNAGALEAGEARLSDAEQILNAAPENPQQAIVIDAAQAATLPASIATARAYAAQARGDGPGSATFAEQALALLPADAHLKRGPAAALLGLTQWANGYLELAYQSLAAAMASFETAGNFVFALSCTYGLADIRVLQGRLHAAQRVYQRSLQLALAQGEPALRGTSDVYLGLSELHREQGDLAAAAQMLQKSAGLGEPAALTDWPYRFHRGRARLQLVQGDTQAALASLDEAERRHFRSPVPDVPPLAAMKARVWIQQGRRMDVLGWARGLGLTVDDAPSFLREFEHITLVRMLLAHTASDWVERDFNDALALLARLLQAAEAGGRWGSVIELLMLQALALHTHDADAAMLALQRALTLAEPEGYFSIFVVEGQPMAQLLRAALARGVFPDHVGKLLAAFPASRDPHAARPSPTLAEPLSERELELLRLIAQGLSNQEICARLFLALDTVKGHNRRIFAKLQVQRRTEAVARARELGLL